eukprot:gnl/Ergobibamus_cyprinoides/1648.p1 GENE.gnl/Ergobibamus_cyprinoides/1648~~gnl/Ergobibamus_cyprinoides/1648.p1  ORF type:complete len:287 (+),score=61.89 gnl/Ergobibamus_cyprinoides/1648:50-862(+)
MSQSDIRQLLFERITPQLSTRLVAAIRSMAKKSTCAIFANPVLEDFPQLTEDYLKKIACPCCLRDIETRLKSSEYTFFGSLLSDAILTADNCIAFNGLKSEYGPPAVAFLASFFTTAVNILYKTLVPAVPKPAFAQLKEAVPRDFPPGRLDAHPTTEPPGLAAPTHAPASLSLGIKRPRPPVDAASSPPAVSAADVARLEANMRLLSPQDTARVVHVLLDAMHRDISDAADNHLDLGLADPKIFAWFAQVVEQAAAQAQARPRPRPKLER